MADARDEPPFEGGSQPVVQRPPTVPPGRRSPAPVILGVLIVVLIAAGVVFLFAH